MSTTKTTYEVKRGFFLSQQFIAPAPEGAPATTIALTEREARYHLLAGDIAPPAVNTPSNAS
ncbi:MAG: hypothetical protein ABL908_13870 [Hyphomicrobium sp.]